MGHNLTLPVPFFDVITKELKVVGSFRYGPGDYPLAISLVERGLIDLKPLVTQRYEFKDALEAFETTRAGKDPQGKVSKGVVAKLTFSPSSSASSTRRLELASGLRNTFYS
jgi:threonine dehydrogenase-like Zn-dependent dehydrogenase